MEHNPPELPAPVYHRTGITLYSGDCLELLPRFPAGSVQVVLADPPYNAGRNYGQWTNDRRPWPEWTVWMDQFIEQALRVAREGMLCFLSQPAYRYYLRHGRFVPAWTAAWVKPLSCSVTSAPFLPHWEPIAYFGDKRSPPRERSKWGSDVLIANVEVGRSRWGHPSPKPLALMRQLVGRFVGPVLDPCAGAGTTLVAAQQLNREAIGIEINPEYVALIQQRLRADAPLLYWSNST